MADLDYERLNAHAATLVRRKHERPALARAFTRDITTFEWRLGKILEHLGVTARTFPSTTRIPGRVAIAPDYGDKPEPAVYAEFLSRGGTLIVERRAVLESLELAVTSRSLAAGSHPVRGSAIAALGLPVATCWCDDEPSTVEIANARVLVETTAGPMVSALSHEGGTVVVFATPIAGYRRTSTSERMVTPRGIANLLAVPVADASDMLADDTGYPDDLFMAQVTMIGVFAGVVAAAL